MYSFYYPIFNIVLSISCEDLLCKEQVLLRCDLDIGILPFIKIHRTEERFVYHGIIRHRFSALSNLIMTMKNFSCIKTLRCLNHEVSASVQCFSGEAVFSDTLDGILGMHTTRTGSVAFRVPDPTSDHLS